MLSITFREILRSQFQGQGKRIYLIGVNFLSEQKEMEDFLVEELD